MEMSQEKPDVRMTLARGLRRQVDEGTGDLLRRLHGDPGLRLTRLLSLGVVIGLISQSIDDAPANAQRDPEALAWGRIAKAVEEGGEAVKAFIGATAQNPRKGVYATLDDVREELLDTAMTALAAWEHLDGNRGNVVDEFTTYTYERILGRLIDPATGKLRPELAHDLVGPDFRWDDRPQRIGRTSWPKDGTGPMEPGASIPRRLAPLPESQPFPWASRAMTDTTPVEQAVPHDPIPFKNVYDPTPPGPEPTHVKVVYDDGEAAEVSIPTAPDPGLSEPRPES